MRVKKASAFESPMYHLSAFGLRNPMVTWCIERGIYDDQRCLRCLGSRIERSPSYSPEGLPDPCWECKGTGLKKPPRVHSTDLGDPDSARLAERLGLSFFEGVEPHQFHCPQRFDWTKRCVCVLR